MIDKMNKRGEETDRIGIVPMGVALAVLIVVILGVSLWFSGKAIPFVDFLPSFNQTKPRVVDIEIFGYDITKDKLQYYDGAFWIDFPKEGIVANEKAFDYNHVFYKLTNDFFSSINSANVEKAAADGKAAPTITIDFEDWATDVDYRFNREKKRWEYNSELSPVDWWGDVKGMGGLYSKENRALAMNLDNFDEDRGYLYLTKLRESFGREKVSSISGIPFGWFVGFIGNRITIEYKDINAEKDDSVITCFIKNNYETKNMLVVDLSEQGGTCPYVESSA